MNEIFGKLTDLFELLSKTSLKGLFELFMHALKIEAPIMSKHFELEFMEAGGNSVAFVLIALVGLIAIFVLSYKCFLGLCLYWKLGKEAITINSILLYGTGFCASILTLYYAAFNLQDSLSQSLYNIYRYPNIHLYWSIAFFGTCAFVILFSMAMFLITGSIRVIAKLIYDKVTEIKLKAND